MILFSDFFSERREHLQTETGLWSRVATRIRNPQTTLNSQRALDGLVRTLARFIRLIVLVFFRPFLFEECFLLRRPSLRFAIGSVLRRRSYYRRSECRLTTVSTSLRWL